MLNIVQLNVRSYWNLRYVVFDYIEHKKPDIILLNSIGITNNHTIKHYGYTSRQTANGAHQGVCILVNHTYKHEFLTDTFQHHSFLAVKVHTHHGPVIVATAYVNPDTGLPIRDFDRLFDRNNYPIFFAGDINAHHTVLHHPRNNRHGRQLHSLFRRKRLHYIGPDFETFIQGNRRGRPDLVFGNRAALPFHSHCSPGPQLGSDHIPIEITISTNPILHPERKSYNYRQADWEAFANGLESLNLENRCAVQGIASASLDDRWQLLLDSIRAQMDQNIPQVTYRVRVSFRPSIRTQRLLACYRARFEHNQNRLEQVQWDLNILRRHVLDSFERDRATHWADLVKKTEELRVPSPYDFWTRIRKLKGTNRPSFDYIIHNDAQVRDPDEVITIMKNHWEGVFHPHEPHPVAIDHVREIEDWVRQHRVELSPLPIVDLSTLDEERGLLAPITLPEVKDKISRLKRKAPGGSRIGRDVVKHLPNSILLIMISLYNASLATGYFPVPLKTAIIVLIPKPGKDPTDPANYRPISLLELLGKIFESILNDRLRDHLEDNSLITSNQFGFRQQRSTQSVINIITQYLTNNMSRNLKSVVVTKDIEKAFDTVWHDGLKYKFYHNFDLPPCFIKLLCSFLDNRRCSIRFLGKLSESFTPQSGTPQGSSLSPTGFIMFTSDIPRPIRRDSLTLLYADDTTHLTRCNGTGVNGAVRFMNRELNAVSYWEHDWRINTNVAKTKALLIRPRKALDAVDRLYLNRYVRYPRVPLQYVKSCTILGFQFDSRLRFHKQAIAKRKQAKHAMSLLYRFGNASTATKRHLYQAMVKPHLCYGPMPLALVAETHRKKLQVIQNKAIRWIHRTNWMDFITNDHLHEITKNVPALNVLWSRLTRRQLIRFRAWCEDWVEELLRLARTGRRVWEARATNLLTVDYADEPEPRY